MRSTDADHQTDKPAPVLGRRNHFQFESHAAAERGHGTAQQSGVFSQPVTRTTEHGLRGLGQGEFRDCDENRLPERCSTRDPEGQR